MLRPLRRLYLTALLLVAALSLSAPAYPAEKAAPANDLDEVWQLVKDRFYDKATGGVNWEKAKEKYDREASYANTPGELKDIINGMLGELRTSHTRYYTKDEVDYYGLVDIFKSGALKENLNKFFPDGKVTYDGIGVITTRVGAKSFVKGVLEGGPADKAGIKRGDEILSVDGAPFEEIRSFAGKAGKETRLILMQGPDPKDVRQVALVPESIDPEKLFYNAMKEGARIIEAGGKKIGYIHVWSYAGEMYQDLLVEQIAEGKLTGADALIVDLREGWGGAAPDYLDVFCAKVPVITETNRDGKRGVTDTQWRKPAVMLINEGSRSGKEILAYGFKKYGIGKLVGTKTAGFVMGGRPFFLTTGNLLYLAVVDVLVDGERLEGVGVAPDVEVPMPLEYTHGKDPQLDEAVRLLSK